jgi:hypothetical protein
MTVRLFVAGFATALGLGTASAQTPTITPVAPAAMPMSVVTAATPVINPLPTTTLRSTRTGLFGRRAARMNDSMVVPATGATTLPGTVVMASMQTPPVPAVPTAPVAPKAMPKPAVEVKPAAPMAAAPTTGAPALITPTPTTAPAPMTETVMTGELVGPTVTSTPAAKTGRVRGFFQRVFRR